MPLDNPLRPPHVRASHRQIRSRHLATLTVRTHRPHAEPQVGGNVRGGPPLGSGIRLRRHAPILADAWSHSISDGPAASPTSERSHMPMWGRLWLGLFRFDHAAREVQSRLRSAVVAVGVRREIVSIAPGPRRDDCGRSGSGTSVRTFNDLMPLPDSKQYPVTLAAPLGKRVLVGRSGEPVPVTVSR